MKNRNGPVRSQLSVLKCWGRAVGAPGDTKVKRNALRRSEAPGLGEAWVARGDGLEWPRRLWQEREGEWGEQKSLLHHPATLANFLFLHCLQVYHSLSPPREAKWTQLSALPETQKVLP